MTIESLFERAVVGIERIANALDTFLTAFTQASAQKSIAAITDPQLPSAQTPAAPPAVHTVGFVTTQAPPPNSRPKRSRAPAAPEQTQPAALTAPAAEMAPSAAAPVASPAVSLDLGPYGIVGVKADQPLRERVGKAIIALANDFNNRDAAIAILGKHGAQRVHELKDEVLQVTFDEVVAAYAQLKSAKLNTQLL